MVPETKGDELDVDGAALAVGMISSMLAKRISSIRLFFIKETKALRGSNITVPDTSEETILNGIGVWVCYSQTRTWCIFMTCFKIQIFSLLMAVWIPM